MSRTSLLSFILVMLCAATVSAQESDPRVTRAVELFQEGKFEDSAKLFEAVEKDEPANFLRLNAMVAWYKADQCSQARAALSRIVDDASLEPPDRQDIDKIGTYCTLKDARAHASEQRWDEALATVEGLTTQDVGLSREIVSFREQVQASKTDEQKRLADAKAAEEAAVPPPPAPEPAPRSDWAWWTGLGLAGAGVGLGVATVIKGVSDSSQYDATHEKFARTYGCEYAAAGNTWVNCSQAQIDGIRSDAAYKEWSDGQVKTALTATTVMAVSSGLLAVGGAGLLAYHFLSHSKTADGTALRLIPVFAPGAASATLDLRF